MRMAKHTFKATLKPIVRWNLNNHETRLKIAGFWCHLAYSTAEARRSRALATDTVTQLGVGLSLGVFKIIEPEGKCSSFLAGGSLYFTRWASQLAPGLVSLEAFALCLPILVTFTLFFIAPIKQAMNWQPTGSPLACCTWVNWWWVGANVIRAFYSTRK